MKRPWFMLPLAPLAVFALPAGAAVSYCDGYAYLTSGTRLLRFDPDTMTATVVRELPSRVNAVAADGGTLYALTRPDPRAVAISADGAMTDLGPIRNAPRDRFRGAYVAAAHDGSWLLLHEERVYTIRLPQPGVAPEVVSDVALDGEVRIGDWTTDASGALISISTHGDEASLVRVDATTGAVEELATPAGLPAGSLYGAVWRLGTRLYAWHNTAGGIYELDLAQPETARKVIEASPSGSMDAAACEAAPASPSPSPSPSPTPSLSAPPVSPSPASPTPPSPVPPPPPPVVAQPPAPPPLVVPPRVVLPSPSPTVTIDTTASPSPSPRSPSPTPTPTSPAPTPEPPSTRRPDERPRLAADEDEMSTYRWIAAGAGAMTLTLVLSLRRRGTRR